MFLKKWKVLLSASLAALLLVLTGCASFTGFDTSKVVANAMNVTSTESNQTVSLEIVPGDGMKLLPEDKAMYDLMKSIKLSFNNTKQQDVNTMSTTGTLQIGTRTVPFKLAMNTKEMTIMIEGAKKPIVLQMNSDASLALLNASGLKLNDLQAKYKEMMQSLVSYFVKSAPTPTDLSVKPLAAKINGESLNLVNLHVDMNGPQIIDFAKQLLTNISKDEKGLKELISGLYDVVIPIVKEAMKNDPDAGELPSMMDNKELAVAAAYQAVSTELKKAVENFDQAAQDKTLTSVLSKNTSIKFDIAVDSVFAIRKSNFELNITLPKDVAMAGPKAINLKVTNEQWNVNKPVKADTIDTSAGAIVVNPEGPNASEPISASQMLKNLDPKSDAYKLLMDDFKVTKKNIKLFISDESDFDEYDYPRPYKANGNTTMVPARFVAQSLDGLVKWDESTNQITITDDLSGKVIVLTINSNNALVNGKAVDMGSAAVIKEGTTFIPLRFIADQMGAKVAWNEEAQLVTITRD